MKDQAERVEADPTGKSGSITDGDVLYKFVTTGPTRRYPVDGATGTMIIATSPFYAFDGTRHAFIEASPERPLMIKVPEDGKRGKQMLRAFHVVAVLLMLAPPPPALAQTSRGHMDLNDCDAMFGTRLAVFRVMFSKTDAICPQQTGLLEIRPDGFIVDIVAIMRNGGPDYRMDPTVASDDFTFRRRIEAESCRIDIDITAQRWGNGKWVPLAVPRARTPDANPPESPNVPNDYVPAARPSSELEALDRSMRARANAGSLLQGWTATDTSYVGFPRERDCFDAIAISQIDRSGVTLLFPAGLQGGLNRFFIERVDIDADHSTLYFSRRSCRVGLTISAAISREGAWVPLPIEPFKPSKQTSSDEGK